MATLTSPTIEELITESRYMLNQPDAANSFWSDEEITSYLNEAARRYFVEVISTMEGQFTTTTDLDIVNGTETVALPADCFKIKNLYRPVTSGFQVLNYRNSINESYSTTGESGGETYIPQYFLRGNSIVLRPLPNFAQTSGLRLEYVQFPTTMVNGGDSLTAQISPVFRDLIVMYAVYKAKLKESLVSGTNTYAPALQNLNDLFTLFKEAVVKRSSNPTYIQAFNPEL